jgi:hypothetical protein
MTVSSGTVTSETKSELLHPTAPEAEPPVDELVEIPCTVGMVARGCGVNVADAVGVGTVGVTEGEAACKVICWMANVAAAFVYTAFTSSSALFPPPLNADTMAIMPEITSTPTRIHRTMLFGNGCFGFNGFNINFSFVHKQGLELYLEKIKKT